MVRVVGGQDGYGRALAAVSPRAGGGSRLAAFEVVHNDGPWVIPDDYERLNGILRYSAGSETNGFSITAMGCRAQWRATDQVPARGVEAGVVDRFGTLDESGGGDRRGTASPPDGSGAAPRG